MKELELEVGREPKKLEEYFGRKLPAAPAGSIFSGAGDSYAAALAGFYASGGRCRALDPYVLASEPKAAEGAEVIFISVSGRTSSNVLAASRVRHVAKKTTVITAVEESPLAKETEEVVLLPMRHAPRSPGMLSFGLSAMAVLKMVGAPGPSDFQGAFRKARSDSRSLSLGRGTTYILGNGLAHAAALYTSAKVYEILGAKAHAEALEEFSHMELLSLRPSDAVNAFADFDPDGMALKLERGLSAEGFRSATAPPYGSSEVERFFHCTFVGQLWCLAEAKRAGIERPRFLAGGKRLRVSDSMIY